MCRFSAIMPGKLNEQKAYTMTDMPMDGVPCHETSDGGRLCRHPVVSVKMLTYNHEPYIAQAIEGVMMQQADFEFELVIGEDASTDRTREICFEYQKRHPDKIRVLWSEENLYASDGNGKRVDARLRGEYVAYCEGDDYWTDPLKLQKQVDLMRRTGAVMCVAFNRVLLRDGRMEPYACEVKPIVSIRDIERHYFHTSTYVLKRRVFERARARWPGIRRWYDWDVLYYMASAGKVALLPDTVSVYRMSGAGIFSSQTPQESGFTFSRMMFELYRFGPRVYRIRTLYRSLRVLAGAVDSRRQFFSRELFERHIPMVREILRAGFLNGLLHPQVFAKALRAWRHYRQALSAAAVVLPSVDRRTGSDEEEKV